MNKKDFTTEDNYKKNVLKRMILLCWILLGVCFAIKIFGGNFFGIICKNKTFIKICNYIDSGYLYWVLAFIFYYINSMIYLYAVTGTSNLKSKINIIFTILLIISYCSKFISLYLGLIADILIIEILCPFLTCKYYKYTTRNTIVRVILGVFLINIFQIISIFVKGLGLFKITNESSLIQMIFNIDYAIMLLLYMFYSYVITKKEDYMGFWGLGWLKDEVEKLKALLAVTTDEEQKKVLTEVIENLEKKAK